MADRPAGWEQNRHPTWELVDMFDNLISGTSLKVSKTNSLITEPYDYIKLNFAGTVLTSVVFKTGGAGGTTVGTITLAYIGTALDTVTKT